MNPGPPAPGSGSEYSGPIAVTTYTYDADGNQTTVTDPLGHITTYAYNALDEEVSETDPSGGGTTTYTYDADGELTTVTDPDDNVTSYTYDDAGNTATETSPTGGVTTYTYDLDGDLTQSVDPDGHTIDYAYDADGRETTETWVNPLGGSPLNLITMTYDADGDMTKIQDASSEYTYTYDNDGNVTSVSDAGTTGLSSVTLTYEYDGDGNRTALDDSLGGLTSYTYDARDELVSEAQSGSGVASKLVNFTYDNDGNLTALTRYSNLAGTSEVAQTTYAYDNADQLTGITDKTSGGTTVASYSYTLDAASRLTAETQTWGSSSDTSSYTYTNNNQLTAVTHTDSSLLPNESFSYDANGNRTMTGYSTGTGNELLSDGTYDYTYDADGNMITQTDIATGVEDVYTYDFRNRLTEVQQVSGGVTTTLATYTYDALDRRIGVSEGGTTTWTLYDGDSPVLDFNGSGTQTARYMNGLNGLAVDTLLARETPSGGTAWYLQDRLGSVGDIVDNSGTMLDHIAYGAFGNVVSESDPSNGDRFKFAGLQYDPVTGTNDAVEREEDSATGRWLTLDPEGFGAGDADLYRYVGDNPVNAVDPLGLSFGSNIGFLRDWFCGVGERVRIYGPDSLEGQEMMRSAGAGKLRAAFYKGGGKDINAGQFFYGSFEAARETLWKPWSTPCQVGGFQGAARANRDGTVTFTIFNRAGTNSFFYHLLPDRTNYYGSMTNIDQYFQWTEPIKPIPIDKPNNPRPLFGHPMPM